MKISPRHLLIVLAAAVAPLALAGSVDVHYDAEGSFTDAGTTPMDRERRLTALAAHLKALGESRLAQDRRLRVELVDLDLTGVLRPSGRTGGDVRMVTGRADGPHIELRYTLSDASQVLATGHETLFDAGLPRLGGPQDRDAGDPLRHEKSLLDRWFELRITSAPAAAR